MGKLMSAVRPKVVSKTDRKLVSALVKDYLRNYFDMLTNSESVILL